MATRQLRNLYEDNEHYNKAFLLYDKLGDRIGTMDRWCQSVFKDDIVSKFNVNIPEGGELRTLGIGSGSGELESHILKQLVQKFPRISNHVVEPSAELSAKYKTYISETSEQLKGIDYHWRQQLLQDFKEDREKKGDKTKFHFISAIHSLYYFDDLGKWLDYLYGLLEDGGILMVFLTAETSSLAHTWAEFPGLGNKQKFGFTDVTSTDVSSHFEKSGIVHQNFLVDCPYDMTKIFDPVPSVESDLLLDFVSHIIDFRKDADSEVKEKMMKFLRRELKKDGDRFIFNGDWGVNVVPK